MQIPVLVGILSTLLSTDKLVTANELAEKFEISKRTVYRYVATLSEGGIPIMSSFGRNGGWGIIDTYKLKATYFTEDEYERVIFCLQSSTLQDDVTKQAIQKLQGLKRSHTGANVLRTDQFMVDSVDYSVRDLIPQLSDCIAQKVLCEIEYHSKDGVNTVRMVEPYCLILKDGAWYVYCFCRLRRGFRYFKVARIVKMTLGDRFVGREYHADPSVIQTDILKDKEMCEVILSVHPTALSACEEWLGVNSVARLGDTYIAKATLPYDELLISKILSLGLGVRVEKPLRLRQDLVERCQLVMEHNYGND